MADLMTIATFLDRTLRLSNFTDSSNNGLQVENPGRVRKICCGVDASMEFFAAARDRGADMVVCHHGISWGDSLKAITHLNYSRVSFLIKNDMALYACHLPLDAHPRHGNNAQICKALGLTKTRPFGLYHGMMIGFEGMLPRPMSYQRFKNLVGKTIGGNLQTMDFGKKTVRSVAVVSGGAPAQAEEAGRKAIDVYLSGEPSLQAYNLARECEMNAIFAGHYATEVFGVRSLAKLLKRTFNLDTEFLDLRVPF